MAGLFHGSTADSNEGVYLANCVDGSGYQHSEMSYYSNAKGASQNQQSPQSIAWVIVGKVVPWEGQPVCGNFASGERFCTSIVREGMSLVSKILYHYYQLFKGAASDTRQSTGAWAGTAYNHETNFNCYKDNLRKLYCRQFNIIQSLLNILILGSQLLPSTLVILSTIVMMLRTGIRGPSMYIERDGPFYEPCGVRRSAESQCCWR